MEPLVFPSSFLGYCDVLLPCLRSLRSSKAGPLIISNETIDACKGPKRMRRINALQGAEEIIVSPERPKKNEILDKVGGHHHRAPPPQLGNPLNFYLPPIPCATPARLHPMYHPAREACDSWLISTLKPQNEAYKQFLIQSMHPLFVCLTMPDALGHTILLLSKLIAWLFLIDTFSDELLLMDGDFVSEKKYSDLILSLLQGSPISSSKDCNINELKVMSEVLLDVSSDIKASMPERQHKRFINIMREMLEATLTESQRRHEQGTVDLDTYLSFRRFTAGGYVFMIMVEFANGIDLDDDILAHPDIIKLQEMVAYYVAYVNDLLSFRKDFCLGHHQNLASILCVHESYNMQESIFRVCRMTQDIDDEFVSLRKKVMMNSVLVEREGVRPYLEALGYVMSGFLEWAYQTGRYHGLNNHLTLRHGLVSLVHLDLTLITQGVIKSELFADN